MPRLQNLNTFYNLSRKSLERPTTPDPWRSDSEVFAEPLPELKPRQADTPTTDVPTCGYLNGNPSLIRTANSGYDCRVDTKYAIWGFCPTTVSAVSDCGFPGGCVDTHACDSGCGIFGDPSVTTCTCTTPGADFCSTALLIDGPHQTYSYLACGNAAVTDNLLITPTSALLPRSTLLPSSTSSSSAPSKAKPSVTIASSAPSATSPSPVTITSILSSAPASSPSSSKGAPSPSNNTGAIVGGVLGGLALLIFVTVAFLFYQRLKPRPINRARHCDTVGEDDEVPRGLPQKAPRRSFPLAELSSDGLPIELSSDRHDETAGLPIYVGGIRRT